MQSLSDRDLLALFVGKRKATKLLSQGLMHLLATSGDPKLMAAMEIVRRGLREQLQRQNVLQSPQAVRDFLRLHLAGKEHEVFVGVFLDAQNHVLAVEDLFNGTLTQTSVYPREVVKKALKLNAGAVIFSHNHPSGVSEPSRSDEVLTQALKQALALVDVKVLDHFIIGSGSAMSFVERGLL